MLAKIAAIGGGSSEETIYVDDVFSAYPYTGNGGPLSINNGIDLAGDGGLVWLKNRGASQNHALYDTARGETKSLYSDLTVAQGTLSGVSKFNTNGFELGSAFNNSTHSFASWTFRKAPKFFDVVTWVGTSTNRTVTHNLGQEPGFILVKRTDAAGDWQVYHRSLANTEYLVLNTSAGKATDATRWNSTTATTSVFSLGTDATVNASGGTYVAYLFAHDTSADGIVQCGSFTTDGSGNATVNLGWEPQYLMMKRANGTGEWFVVDSSRPWSVTTLTALVANASVAEVALYNEGYSKPFSTGFTTNGLTGGNQPHIYMAIRRPNKPPTLGTQVYNGITRTGTGAAAKVTGVGFPPDLVISRKRVAGANVWWDRLRGPNRALMSTVIEAATTNSNNIFDQDGITVGADTSNYSPNVASNPYINHFFKRALGVFDTICYTGTGVSTLMPHNLGVAPELIITKKRSAAGSFVVMLPAYGWNMYGYLNSSAAFTNTPPVPFGTLSSSTMFDLHTNTDSNASGATFIAYLFATKAGVSKVGIYTGNGSNQTINCGFSTGARFILIKRADAVSDWYIWDSVRGIVAGNDPHISLNTTAGEATTDDSIDPDASGFIVNQLAATNININAGTYIFLAFA